MTPKSTKKTKAAVARKAGFKVAVTTAVKEAIKKPVKDQVVRNQNGSYAVNGKKASSLVNQYPEIKIWRATVKPKHLTNRQISEMVRSMKMV